MLKFPLCSLGQVDSLGRAIPHLTAEQALGTAGRTLAEVSGLPTPAYAPKVLVEGHLHPCWGWTFDAQLGTVNHVPVLLAGLLDAGYGMRWLLCKACWSGGCSVVEGCCAGRAGLLRGMFLCVQRSASV